MLVSAVSSFMNSPSYGLKKAIPSKQIVSSVSDDFARRKIKLATSLSAGALFIGCLLMAARKGFSGVNQRHLYLLT